MSASPRRIDWLSLLVGALLALVCLLGWRVHILGELIELERTYRANTREKVIRALTLVEQMAEDEKAKRAVEELLEELRTED